MPARSWMANGLQLLGGGTLLLAVLTAPWLIGGVASRAQWGLYSAIGVAGLLWALSVACSVRDERGPVIGLPSILWPMGAYLALGLFQLSPVQASASDGELPAVPQQLPWGASAGGSRSEEEQGDQSPREVLGAFRSTSTLSPASTRFALARLTFAVIATFLASQFFRKTRQARWLWGGLALNGCALAFLGFVQMLSWNGKLLWTIPLELGGQPFATYVNRNNAAGYLNLCLAGGIALLSSRAVGIEESDEELAWDDAPSNTRGLRTLGIAAGLAIATIAAGIVASASRGGTLGMICGAAVVGVLSLRRGAMAKSLAGLLAIVAVTVAVAVWTGAGERLGNRLTSSPVTALQDNGRWAHWSDALNTFRDFPVTGTGLGTYRFAVLPYQSHPSDTQFLNADNQFVETLVEGGAVGLALVLAAVVLFGSVLRGLSRSSTEPGHSGVVLAGVFLLVSQSVCGFFDFGPIVTANMLTLAVLVGSLCGHQVCAPAHLREAGADRSRLSLRSLGRVGLVVVLFAAGSLSLREVHGVVRLDQIRSRVPSLTGPEAIADAELAAVLTELDGIETDNPEVHQFAADLWAHRFRLAAFAQARRADPTRSAPEIWDATQLPLLHRQVNDWARSGQLERLRMLAEDPGISTLLVPCVARLQRTTECCPFFSRSDLMLASLAFVRSLPSSEVGLATSSDATAGLNETYRGLRIAPSLERSLLFAAELFDASGRTAEAQACWKRCATFYPQSIARVHRRVSPGLAFDEELRDVLPASPAALLNFARAELTGDHKSVERESVGARILELLSLTETLQTLSDGETYRLKAGAWELRGDYDASILSLEQSISLAPLEADPRLELSRVFQRMGRISEAREQALIAASLRPRDVEARRLLSDLQRTESRVPSTKPSSP